jgi:hypothetical protein
LEVEGASPSSGWVRIRVIAARDERFPRSLAVLDTRGRLIRHLAVSATGLSQGAAVWDGNDEAGRMAPAGLYFVCSEGVSGGLAVRLVHLPRR